MGEGRAKMVLESKKLVGKTGISGGKDEIDTNMILA
jgi:hypothetical protein